MEEKSTKNTNHYLRFQVLKATSKNMAVFWDVAQCSPVYVMSHPPDDGGNKLLRNVSMYLQDYMTQHPGRQP
jgi:hypothetical protein